MNRAEEKHPVKGMIITILYLSIFVGIAGIVTFLTTSYAEASHFFDGTAIFAAGIGVPLSIFAGLTAYHDKGTKKRMIFGYISGALMLIYFIAVLSSLNIGWQGEEYVYQLTIPGVLVLIAITVLLRFIFYGLEYRIYNKRKKRVEKQGVTYY